MAKKNITDMKPGAKREFLTGRLLDVDDKEQTIKVLANYLPTDDLAKIVDEYLGPSEEEEVEEEEDEEEDDLDDDEEEEEEDYDDDMGDDEEEDDDEDVASDRGEE